MVRPYSTCESLGSLVVQVMAALVEPTDDTLMLESTGGVVSILATVTLTAAEVAVLPAASRATAGGGGEAVGNAGGVQAPRKGGPGTPGPRVGGSSLYWAVGQPPLYRAGRGTGRE